MLQQKRRGIQWTYRREIVAALFFIVLFIVFAAQRQAGGIEFLLKDDQITITGPSGAPDPIVLDCADIQSISQRTGLEPGSYESGLNSAQCRFGAWRSSEFGEYTLCASPAASEYIVLETAQGIVVLNYQDDDTTIHLYTALVELLESKGMEVGAGAG